MVTRREPDTERFKDTLRHLLDKGGFDEIREEDFEAALEEKSMMGLEVLPPSKEKIRYELYYRGVRRKQVRMETAAGCAHGPGNSIDRRSTPTARWFN